MARWGRAFSCLPGRWPWPVSPPVRHRWEVLWTPGWRLSFPYVATALRIHAMAIESTGGTDTSGRPDPLVGRRLASYEVLARVARGGMGVVYRARHVYIDKIVALKVLDPGLAQRVDLIERFRTEAQSLARVEHE